MLNDVPSARKILTTRFHNSISKKFQSKKHQLSQSIKCFHSKFSIFGQLLLHSSHWKICIFNLHLFFKLWILKTIKFFLTFLQILEWVYFLKCAFQSLVPFSSNFNLNFCNFFFFLNACGRKFNFLLKFIAHLITWPKTIHLFDIQTFGIYFLWKTHLFCNKHIFFSSCLTFFFVHFEHFQTFANL